MPNTILSDLPNYPAQLMQPMPSQFSPNAMPMPALPNMPQMIPSPSTKPSTQPSTQPAPSSPLPTTPQTTMPQPSSPVPTDLTDQNLQELFPDLYNTIKPHIDQIAAELKKQEVTDSMIDSIVQEILLESGMTSPETAQQNTMEPTLAPIYDMGYGRYPNPYFRRRRYPRYYYNLSLEDLVRLMLLQQLGGYGWY